MESILTIFRFLLILIVGGIFAYIYLSGKAKATIEEGLTPIFEEQAGGRFDNVNLTIPFVRHAIYDDFVAISYGKTKYILKFNEIKRVENKRHIFSKGLIYHHNKAGIPAKCIIWSRDGNKAIDILKSHDIPT